MISEYQEIVNAIEEGLNEEDINRIWILIKGNMQTDENIFEKIKTWKKKLINKEHIEGTPWNIPAEQKSVLWSQWEEIAKQRRDCE